MDSLFLEADAPGDPPEGSKPEKARAWLSRCNKDPSTDCWAVLEYLLDAGLPIEESRDPQNAHMRRGNDHSLNRIDRLLTKSGLMFEASTLRYADGSARPAKPEFDVATESHAAPTREAAPDESFDIISSIFKSSPGSSSQKVHAAYSGVQSPRSNGGTARLFISHSSADQDLADAFVDLLETGIQGLSSSHIFCTSLEGLGIPAGMNFVEHIRGQLSGCTAFIPLVSSNYVRSDFCLCELGATWALLNRMLPVIAPAFDTDRVPGILRGVQYKKLDLSSDLDDIRDHIVPILAIAPGPTARWNKKRDHFLRHMVIP